MCFYMLETGQLREKAELNSLDTLAIIIAAVCHDFGHDGFNNSYHVSVLSDRALRYNDISV
jgi:hypothetical protein